MRTALVAHFMLLLSVVSSNQDSHLSCRDWSGAVISEGTRFMPDKGDPCRTCACENGYEVRCLNSACLPPTCEQYEQIDGECCQHHCITPPLDIPKSTTALPDTTVNTSNLGLRLVAGFLTILLTLALVMFLIHRLRRRRILMIMRRREEEQLEEDVGHYIPDLDDPDMTFDCPPYEEPPPPYTPAKTPTEAPPPYETLPRGTSGDTIAEPHSGGTRGRLLGGGSADGGGNAHDSMVTTDTFVSGICGDSRTSSGFLSSNQTLDISETCDNHVHAPADTNTNANEPSCSYTQSSTLPVVRKKTPSAAKIKQDKKRRNSSPLQFLLENEQAMNQSACNSPIEQRRDCSDEARKNGRTQVTQKVNKSLEVRSGAEVSPQSPSTSIDISGETSSVKFVAKKNRPLSAVDKNSGGSKVLVQQDSDKVVIWSTAVKSNSPRHSYADKYTCDELQELQKVGQYLKPALHTAVRLDNGVVKGSDSNNTDNTQQGDLYENGAIVESEVSPPSGGFGIAGSESITSQLSAISINPETGEKRLKTSQTDQNLSVGVSCSASTNLPKETANNVSQHGMSVDASQACDVKACDDKRSPRSSYRYVETEPQYQRLRNESTPERNSRAHKRPDTVYKQYGFVDDPTVLSAQDPNFVNAVCTIEHDLQRSRSYERVSHNSRERRASGERSQSGSRRRSRSGSRERPKTIRDRSRERALLHKQEKAAKNSQHRHTMNASQLSAALGKGDGASGTCEKSGAKIRDNKKYASPNSKQRRSVPNIAFNGVAQETSMNKKVQSKNNHVASLKSPKLEQSHDVTANGNVSNHKAETTNGTVNRSTSDNNIHKVRVKKKHRNSLHAVSNLPSQSAYL